MNFFATRVARLTRTGLAAAVTGATTFVASMTADAPALAYDCLSQNPADWPAPAKPYFMIAFDTSGSMLDPVPNPASPQAPSCSGYPANRIGHGRCAVKNTVLAFSGLASFGLASYARVMTGCAAGTCANDFSTCNFANVSGNNNGNGCNTGCGPEPSPLADSSTRAGANILVPLRKDTTPPSADNTPQLVAWVDNDCTGNQELFPSGCTPMNGILRDMHRYYQSQWVPPSPQPGGATLVSPLTSVALGERACRSVNVILVTDGEETCDSAADAADAAADMFAGFTKDGINWKVKTFVIDFGGVGSQANAIAAAGGTGTAKTATNEAELSKALAEIIAGSVAPEVCDNGDNNCNGCVDEGFKHYCDVGKACCPWSTPAERTACLDSYKQSLKTTPPEGDLALLPCTTTQQQTQSSTWLCYNPKEACDNADNNCQDGIDEGTLKCGNPAHCPQAETCNGSDDDCDGQVDENVCNCAVTPSSEVCDGCDNDCDGFTDNGVAPLPCGFSPPNNCAGVLTCKPPVAVAPGTCIQGGGFNTCSNSPQAEVCDGIDNDCNGTVDNGVPPTACTPAGTPPGLVYGGTSQCQKGSQACGGTCQGFLGPSAEVCDGIDNDCDGQVDEGAFGVGQQCGTNTVPCSPGTTACVAGALVCQGGVGPKPEVCDGIDNDCDGQKDEAPLSDGPAAGQNGCWNLSGNMCSFGNLTWNAPPGASCNANGSLTAPCNRGTLVCQGASGWSCQNAKTPSAETCDGLDNNCNGQVDDGIAQVGQACGTGTGECTAGTYQCSAGKLDCVGDVGPGAEVCDGLDNDCDGQIDENVPGAGVACGNSTAPCVAGTTACVGGALICQGAIGPKPETCDGIDNDCDGQKDEAPLADGPAAGQNGCWNLPGNMCSFGPLTWNPPPGGTCNANGSLTAPCDKGTLACVSAAWTCQNPKPPSAEVCDGTDNNCNGAVDDVAVAACTPPGTPGGLVFGGASQCKMGTQTCGACAGFVGPSAEVCDGIDNDCDGVVDDNPASAGTACGNSTPPCSAGTTVCVNGALVCQGGTGPQPETCDGADNDCDGQVDEAPLVGAPAPGQNGCWTLPGNTCSFGNLSWNPPPGATCNGNGALTAPCNKGAIVCGGAGGWACQNATLPGAEVCDGVDNNCNGVVDDAATTACVAPGTPSGIVFGGTSQCVMGSKVCGACMGFVGPSQEVCDGVDNNCDGLVDNSIIGVGGPCGINQPPCSAGVTTCKGGVLTCEGGVGPTAESCDGIDNDCDGMPDDPPLADAPAAGQNGCWTVDPGSCPVPCSFNNLTWCPPPGAGCNDLGTLMSPCHQGTVACAGGTGWVCQNANGPAPEACDGLDNDCNGLADDGAFPQVGQECGDDTGECQKGAIACFGGNLDCLGEIGPAPETCDGLDNDCDGQIDNGVQPGGDCTPEYDMAQFPGDRSHVPCQPGTLICVSGIFVCQGGLGPQAELCDGVDNDCDGTIDEVGAPPDGVDGTANPLPPPQASIGDACGVDTGLCQQGNYACLNGLFACVGGQGPTPEECDCNDNDCDGASDNENTNGPPICSTGKECVKGTKGFCQCAEKCGAGENPCPPGQVCDKVVKSSDGTDLGFFCVADPDTVCGDCAQKIVKDANGTMLCAPAGTPEDASCTTPPVCVCKGQNGCQDPCFNVLCDTGLSCATHGPNAGKCVPNNCWNVPCVGCDQVCHAGACVQNPCTDASCPAGQACKPTSDYTGVVCVNSCAGVDCAVDEKCAGGACVKTCNPACADGQVCDESQSPPVCVASKCEPNPCTNGACCDPLTGACGDCPCEGVVCPAEQACVAGDCVGDGGQGGSSSATGSSTSTGGGMGGAPSTTSASSGSGEAGGSRPDDDATWGLPTGGGGCACELGAGAPSKGDARIALIALALAAAGLRRRRGRERGSSPGRDRHDGAGEASAERHGGAR